MKINYFNAIKIAINALWTQAGGRTRIEAAQRRNLHKLVDIARNKSPLFAKLYADAPPTQHVQLQDLPITRKPELMAQFDQWLTDRALTEKKAVAHMADMDMLGIPLGNCIVVRTSGTTGEPLIATIPASVLESKAATTARMDKTIRRKITQFNRQLQKKGGTRVVTTGGNGHFAGNSMAKFASQQQRVSAASDVFIGAEEPIENIVAQLNKIATVTAMTTYPSMLTLLVREQEAGRLHIDLNWVQLSGETLTDDLREKASKAFPSIYIQNTYASSECLFLGNECQHGRMHLMEDWVILEAINEHEQAVADGTVSDACLLTYMGNELQPFIRYKMGDRIKFFTDPCPCGSPFRSFTVEGRQATILHFGDVALSALVFDLEHDQAARVQLVQVAERELEVRVEFRVGANSEAVFDQLIANVQDVLRSNQLTDVSVIKSDKPPKLGASGKFHTVVPYR